MWARAGIVVAGSVVACYHPSAQPGIPCSAALTCPGDQVCDTRQAPPICVDHLGDPLVDAPGDGACQTSAQCPASQPVCDPADRVCRGCRADSECPGEVCHELTGACVDEATAIYVAPTGTDNASCARSLPCATLGAGVQALSTTRTTIKLAAGSYTGGFQIHNKPGLTGIQVLISGPRTGWDGAIIAATGTVTVDSIPTTIEGVTIANAISDGLQVKAPVTLSRVLIETAGQDGIDTRGDKLTVLDSSIDGSAQLGINAIGSELDVERSRVVNNKNGGISSTSAPATIVNSVIASNGAVSSSVGGVHLASGTSAVVFRFDTVADNSAATVAAGIACDQPIAVEDSIIANNQGIVFGELGAMCAPNYCLFATTGANGNGNLTGNPMFVSAPTDYHLRPGSPAIDHADPGATESIDLDGGHRPTGAARDIGADEQP